MAKARRHKIDYSRLAEATRQSRLSSAYQRQQRVEAVKQLVGMHCFEEGSKKPVPVNMIALYVAIVSRALVPKHPRILLDTFDKPNKPAVDAMQSWANKEIARQQMAVALRRIVVDALFTIGIAQVSIATPADAARVGWGLAAGDPFLSRVDYDDWADDPNARDWSECTWMGKRVRVPLDAVKDSTLYGKSRRDLQPSPDAPFNEEGDLRISMIGRGWYGTDAKEFKDFADLWEFYLPLEKTVVTFPCDQGGLPVTTDGPLREVEWVGPDTGPYHFLGYGTVPGNRMPKAPVQDLMDLHLLNNELFRKLWRQASRQKSNTFVSGGANEDGTRVMNANDGDILKVDNPEKINEVQRGGPNQGNFLFQQAAWKLFSAHAGNLEMLGGLAPQSKTATQDKMLESNATGQIAGMQEDTILYVAGCMRSLCWYWWHHPQKVMRTKYQVPGMPEFSTLRKVTPQQRQRTPWADLDIEVDPYSLQQQTPQSRAQALTQTVMQIVMPMMQLMQQQGIAFNMGVFLDKIAQYLDMPDLGEILTTGEPQFDSPEGGGSGGTLSSGKPAETTRNYVRRSLGGDSEQSQTADRMSQLAGAMGKQNGQTMNPNGAMQ